MSDDGVEEIPVEAEPQSSPSRRWLIHNKVWLDLAGTFALFLAAGVGAVAVVISTIDANKLVRHSDDNFKLDQRPYVWLKARTDRTTGFFSIRGGDAGHVRPSYFYEFQNFGKGMAVNVRIEEHITLANIPSPKRCALHSSSAVPMPPGTVIGKTAVGCNILTTDAYNALVARDHQIGIILIVTYRDVYGKHYLTRVCFQHFADGYDHICDPTEMN